MKTGGLEDQTISKPHSERVREAAMAQLEHLFFPETGSFPFSKVYKFGGRVFWPCHWWEKLHKDSKRSGVFEKGDLVCYYRAMFIECWGIGLLSNHPLHPFRQYLSGFVDKRDGLLKKEYAKVFQVAPKQMAATW